MKESPQTYFDGISLHMLLLGLSLQYLICSCQSHPLAHLGALDSGMYANTQSTQTQGLEEWVVWKNPDTGLNESWRKAIWYSGWNDWKLDSIK